MSHQVSPSLIKIRLLPVVGGGNRSTGRLRELMIDDAEGVVLAPGMDLSTTPWDVAQECGYGAELVGTVPLEARRDAVASRWRGCSSATSGSC